MKTLFTTIAAIFLLAVTCSAQWTPGTGIITTTNSVGIGTTTPAGKLQVQSSGWDLLTSQYTLDIGLSGTPGGWARGFRIVNSSGSDGTDGGVFGVKGAGTTPNFVYMAIPTSTTSPVGYNSTKMLVLDNFGNVGMGTTTPGLKAHIVGELGFPVATGTAQTGVLRLQAAGSSGVLDFSVNGGGGASLQVTSSSDLSHSYPLVLNPNGGNIGIGTAHPDQRLTVNGTVHSSQVIVDANVPVPDYVFDKTYNLPALKAVKTYIDKNHHLPEIPSATEIIKNGQNLGEMNTLLLKKVEELTLYLIEKDKQDEKKTAQLAALQAQIDRLKQQLTNKKNSR